jgi:DNA-binding response OmpR family regulator
LIQRLKLYSENNPHVSIACSAELPLIVDFEAAVLPAPLLLDPGFPKAETIHRLHGSGCSLICFGTQAALAACFLAGCDDYLKDPWSPEELGWRVRRLRGQSMARFRFSWGAFEIGSLELRSSSGSCRLCAQEQSILRLLASNAGEPVSREALYYGMWGKPPPSESRVVDMHIASLRRKLLLLFPESSIRSVRGVGYLLVS